MDELTKRIAKAKREELKAKGEFLIRQRKEHQDAIAAINAELQSLIALRDALTADIPEPTAIIAPEA